MAGALGLALGGPRRYGGTVADEPWLGDGRARLDTADIRRALLVFTVACGLLVLAVLAGDAALILVRAQWRG